MSLKYLCPQPQSHTEINAYIKRQKSFFISNDRWSKNNAKILIDEIKALKIGTISKKGFPILLMKSKKKMSDEAYLVNISEHEITIESSTDSGLFYGVQTLLQIMKLSPNQEMPICKIEDHPQYKTRSYMVDMGRSVYTFSFLKHMVKVLSRLKINTLHLHLCDDQLGSLRYKKLPFGQENPFALHLNQLKELIIFARKYHISIIPEIECWGHAGSMIYHIPELYGAPGMWEGMSFCIGEKLFQTLDKVFDELIPVLEKECQIHIGLDEANWAIDKNTPPKLSKQYNPTYLVKRIYDILQAKAKKNNKKIKIHLWADHGGRPLPKGLEKKFVVQPWSYFEDQEEDIKNKVAKYSGGNKTPFMLGAGMSSNHYQGHFGATKVWCQAALKSPNVEGVTICHWENNCVPEQLLGLFGGADHAWSPNTPHITSKKPDTYRERIHAETTQRMFKWQTEFPEADHERLMKERGPAIHRGYYMWGSKKGRKVAPTAEMKKPRDKSDNMDQ